MAGLLRPAAALDWQMTSKLMQAALGESTADKALLRKRVLAARDGLDDERRIELSLAAAAHGVQAIAFEPGTIISGFFPIRSEIDARPLMDALREKGARLCVPAVVDRQTIEFRELLRGAPLVDTGFGTVGPGPDAKVLTPEIMIMPLAAFDEHGNRLGYGAGHYDRAIARIAAKGGAPALIGLAFDLQQVDAIPAEDHDRRLHAIITESGYRQFGEA
ncbi:hypothetical protein MMPV_009837 [Pyropia vietnamensis]